MNYYNNYRDILSNLTYNEEALLKSILYFSEEDNQINIKCWDTILDVADFNISQRIRRRTLNKFFKLKIFIPLTSEIAIINPLYFHKGNERLRLDLVKEFKREELEYGK